MKRLLVLIPILWVMLLGADPAWYSDQPPSPNVLYGRGAAQSKNRIEAQEAAMQEAFSDISRHILSEVRASVHTSEYEGNTYSSSFHKQVQVESCVELCGHKVEHQDYIKNTYYVLISVSRERLINHYMNMVTSVTDEAIATYDKCEKLLSDGNHQAALTGLQQLRGRLEDLAVYTRVFSALYSGSLYQAIPKLNNTPQMGVVDSQIAQIKGNPRQGYKELADDIISQFDAQLQQPLSFQVSCIEWVNTGFASSFSEGFSEHLAGELERRFKWSRIRGSGFEKPDIVLGGQIIPEIERMSLFIRSVGKYNGTYSTQLSPNTIDYFGIDFIKPEGLEQALAAQKILIDEAVQSGQLQVWVRFPEFENTTAVYKIGDKVKILLKTNKPCYLTAINVEVGGDWNVLAENVRIIDENVGKWVSLTTDTFNVVEPTGVEQILVQASLNPLPEYQTRTVRVHGGVKQISEGVLDGLAKSRGIAIQKSDSDEYTESYLTWTVLK